MNYVIIGNSAAAVGCVEGIRQADKTGSITIISNEPHHTYSRPLISYLIYGKTDEDRMKYRPDDFYTKNGCTALLGVTVAKIDKENKQVILDDGAAVPYDKLLVATGSKPFVPPMQGLDKVKNAFTFMTLDSAKALDAALTPESRVLIVGAGLIGLKCAEGIAKKVSSITVVDLAPRILPSILDEEGSAMMQRHIESKGVTFILGDSVKEFTETTATLNGGGTVEFDVAVLCVGVRPNVELVKDAGGTVGRGIATDEFCRTDIPDVYAAGDCSESVDITDGACKVLALLPNAYMQGETAGLHMAGTEKPYNKALAMNAIGFFGLHIITAGCYQGEEFVKRGRDGKTYKKLVYADNRLKGYILIGDIARAGIYTALIREQTPLDTIDFDLIRERPQLMAFSHKDRAQKLSTKA